MFTGTLHDHRYHLHIRPISAIGSIRCQCNIPVRPPLFHFHNSLLHLHRCGALCDGRVRAARSRPTLCTALIWTMRSNSVQNCIGLLISHIFAGLFCTGVDSISLRQFYEPMCADLVWALRSCLIQASSCSTHFTAVVLLQGEQKITKLITYFEMHHALRHWNYLASCYQSPCSSFSASSLSIARCPLHSRNNVWKAKVRRGDNAVNIYKKFVDKNLTVYRKTYIYV